MKSCDEMVSNLLRRRDAYVKERKERRKLVLRVAAMACSLALAVFISTGIGQGWWILPESENPIVYPTQNPTEHMAQLPTTPTQPSYQPTQPTQSTQPTVTTPKEQNYIVVNEIGDISNEMMYIALMRDDFVPMTEAELKDYYGTEFVPEVPEDLADLRRETHLGIYRRDGGTGEVYHDEQRLTWSTEDLTRGVNVTVNKGGMPYQFFALLTEEYETSVIRDVAVGIGRTDAGMYLAEFMYRDVGFRMIAEGLTQEELVDVIASLIDEM